MSDYPKLMFKAGQETTVTCPSDEAEKAAEGWRVPGAVVASEPAPEAAAAPVSEEAEVEDEPTFGPPGDQTHAKRPAKGSKKK